jgi:alginate O-acetyltransferase complex protein AlgI
VLGVVINLLVLAFFKYAYLFVSLLFPGQTLDAFKATVASIPLPIGISFYTFHSISLLVDLYTRGVVGVQSLEDTFARGRHLDGFLRVTLYISFFPQLIAGPIVKAHQFFDQIKPKFIRDIDWHSVLGNVITGYFLKMVIADNLKDVTRLLTSDKLSVLGRLDLIALLYGYSFQIFADFAGYSLIAIGLGHLFGYRLPTNFNFPYISASVTEFWRRWHISLSSFLRDYLYIPLGGNRKGRVRTYINLLLTMLLGGLWHGAAWHFVLWGLYHGVLLAIYRRLDGEQERHDPLKGVHNVWQLMAKMAFMLTLTMLGWLIFRASSGAQILYMLKHMGVTASRATPEMLHTLLFFSVPLFAVEWWQYAKRDLLAPLRLAWWGRAPIYALILVWVCVFGVREPTEFIYFQF